MIARVTGGIAVATATALIACGGALASTTPVKHPTAKNHRGWKMTCKQVNEKKHGKTVKVKKCTFSRGKIKTSPGHGVVTTGPQGPTGSQGPSGPKGDAGPAGGRGADGATPLTFGPYASSSADSGDCGNNWANDTYDRTFVVQPEADGSFNVTEIYSNGKFTTIAGDAPGDSSTDCSSSSPTQVPGGVKGTFYGYDLFRVASGATAADDFNPTATCPAGCTADQWFTAFFGIADHNSIPQPVWAFHYSTSNSSWLDAFDNNTGNITG